MTEALSPAQQFILGSITRRLAQVDRPTVRKPLTEVLHPVETPMAATCRHCPRLADPRCDSGRCSLCCDGLCDTHCRRSLPPEDSMADESPRTETPPRQARQRTQKRRNYAKELSDLQSKVDMAIRLLRKAEESKSGPDTLPNWALVSVAVDTLEG